LLLATEAGNRGARERALLLVAYDTMYRRSKLVSLLLEDIIQIETNGITMASILIRKSKADQLVKGRRFNIFQQVTEDGQR
jgi:site-specific recombinase XerD